MTDEELNSKYQRKGELITSIEILNNELKVVNHKISAEIQRRQAEANGLREIVAQ